MKALIAVLFLFISFAAHAEHKVKIYHEQTKNGYVLYADNEEYCPVSVTVKFDNFNLKIENNRDIYVIPPRCTKKEITALVVINKQLQYSFSYNTFYNYGDHTITNVPDFDYLLPYKQNETYYILQGYNGAFSHKNEYSLDFSLPVGTAIHAIRDGVVVQVIQVYDKTCPTPDCAQFNNYIMVYQPDGSFAEYHHIKQNGAKVHTGDKITAGQLLGYSGNVGWSAGPHLHLMVYLQKMTFRETLKTKFLTGKGDKSEYLEEKASYTREY